MSSTEEYLKMQMEPSKIEETKKTKNEEKTQKLKKIEIEEKGNICLENGSKIDINDLHEKWAILQKKW